MHSWLKSPGHIIRYTSRHAVTKTVSTFQGQLPNSKYFSYNRGILILQDAATPDLQCGIKFLACILNCALDLEEPHRFFIYAKPCYGFIFWYATYLILLFDSIYRINKHWYKIALFTIQGQILMRKIADLSNMQPCETAYHHALN